MPGIPVNLYETSRMQIQSICRWGEKEQLLELAKGYKTDYGRYLEYITEN